MTCKTKFNKFDGIPVGFNIVTGTPVKIYVNGTMNNSVAIMGSTGSGKTFAMKLITKRLSDADPSAAMFVIDPFDEYGDVAKNCKLDSVSVNDCIPEFNDRSVIALKDQRPDDPKRAELLVGVLKNAWERIQKMPCDDTKTIILDDARFILNNHEGKKIIGDVLRMGIKLNVMLLVAVQRVQDIEDDFAGNFCTRVFMRLTEPKEEGKAAGLDVVEVERISKLQCGNGMIDTANHRIYARFR